MRVGLCQANRLDSQAFPRSFQACAYGGSGESGLDRKRMQKGNNLSLGLLASCAKLSFFTSGEVAQENQSCLPCFFFDTSGVLFRFASGPGRPGEVQPQPSTRDNTLSSEKLDVKCWQVSSPSVAGAWVPSRGAGALEWRGSLLRAWEPSR